MIVLDPESARTEHVSARLVSLVLTVLEPLVPMIVLNTETV
jgi:hypothetical protein